MVSASYTTAVLTKGSDNKDELWSEEYAAAANREEEADLMEDCMLMFNGDKQKAREMFATCTAWRQQLGVLSLLESPHDAFDFLKRHCPNFMAGRARDGAAVAYVLIGKGEPDVVYGNLKERCAEEIALHIATQTEFVRTVLHAGRKDLHSIAVLDWDGMTVAKCTTPVIRMAVRTYAEVMTVKQPFRLGKLLVVNPPFGIGIVKRFLWAVFPKSFADKIVILNSLEGLQEYIAPEMLPVQYGGTSTTPLHDTPEERQLRQMIERARNRM